MKPWLNTFLGSGLGAGLIPVAPGTFGTLSGLILMIPLHLIWGFWGIILFILMAISLNYLTYADFEQKFGIDPGGFVLDEWAGYGIAILPIYVLAFDAWIGFSLGFAFFRLFDITKIWGIDALQNLEGPHGVLFDDLLAGLYAAICLYLLIFAFS
jgi:phosphatidylglycerophosphatase A